MGGMRLLFRTLAILGSLAGTILLWMGQVGPEDAVSNFAKWAKLLGVESLPSWLMVPTADAWVSAFGAALLVACLGVLALRWRRWRPPTAPQTIESSEHSPNDELPSATSRLRDFSPSELRAVVDSLNQQMRRFANGIREADYPDTMPAVLRMDLPKDQRDRLLREADQRSQQRRLLAEGEFRERYLPLAQALYRELRMRNGLVGRDIRNPEPVLLERGMFAGPYPIHAAANSLDELAVCRRKEAQNESTGC